MTIPPCPTATRLLLLLGFLLTVFGCAVWRKPEVAFRGLSVGAFGPDGAALEIALDVYNPNRYSLELTRMTYRLSVEGREWGSGSTGQEVFVEAKQWTTVRLPLALDWVKLKSSGLEILSSGAVAYTLEGEVTFTTPLGTFERSYRHSGRYSLFGNERS